MCHCGGVFGILLVAHVGGFVELCLLLVVDLGTGHTGFVVGYCVFDYDS